MQLFFSQAVSVVPWAPLLRHPTLPIFTRLLHMVLCSIVNLRASASACYVTGDASCSTESAYRNMIMPALSDFFPGQDIGFIYCFYFLLILRISCLANLLELWFPFLFCFVLCFSVNRLFSHGYTFIFYFSSQFSYFYSASFLFFRSYSTYLLLL